MKFFLCFCLLCSMVFGDYILKLPANATSLKLSQNTIFIGMDNSTIYKYDLLSRDLNLLLRLPTISNYYENNLNAKVFSIDEFNGILAVLFEGNNGKKRLGIYSNSKFDFWDFPIQAAKEIFFLNSSTILAITISSDIYYYDFIAKKITFQTKLTTSTLGDAAINKDRSVLVSGSEGGVVFYFDIKAKQITKSQEIQKDKIYSLDFDKNMLISGSADQSCYFFDGKKSKYFDGGFLVYAVGLSDDYAAFAAEQNIKVINKNTIKTIPYQGASLNFLFFSPDYLIGSGYDNIIYFWSYK